MRIILFFLTISLSQYTIAQNQSMDSLSYSLGLMMASNLKEQGFEKVDAQAVASGIADFMNGDSLKVDIASAQRIVNEHFQKQKQAKHQATIEAGKKFLVENGARPEVKTLPSGLQYEVLNAGPEGPSPDSADQVTVHYEGTLLDGTVFDSSVKRGQPATFGVGQVIKGWTEALQLMKAGDKWKLYIPYDLAYGERGAGRDIGPFSTLVFEVELLQIN